MADLFYVYPGMDQAIIEVAESTRFLTTREISIIQSFELKLCALFLEENASIVLNRTYLEESASARLTMRENADLAEYGFVKLLTAHLSASDERERKQIKYENVRDIQKYYDAYYAKRKDVANYSAFIPVDKPFSLGRIAHTLWTQRGREFARRKMSVQIFDDLIIRIEEADTGNSTWESIKRLISKLDVPKLIVPFLHRQSFTTYIDAHRQNGVRIITGSKIATTLFTGPAAPIDFDMDIFRRFVYDYSLDSAIKNSSASTILRCKYEIVSASARAGIRGQERAICERIALDLEARMRASRSRPTRNGRTEPAQMMPLADRQFRVALSFPGANRAFVEKVYKRLCSKLSPDDIFYDKSFQAELASPNLDVRLQSVYHKQSKLVVVFLAPNYATSDWCGLEWRAIRDLIKTKHSEKIMLIKIEDVEIEGLFSIDGYINASKLNLSVVADYIFKKLSLLP